MPGRLEWSSQLPSSCHNLGAPAAAPKGALQGSQLQEGQCGMEPSLQGGVGAQPGGPLRTAPHHSTQHCANPNASQCTEHTAPHCTAETYCTAPRCRSSAPWTGSCPSVRWPSPGGSSSKAPHHTTQHSTTPQCSLVQELGSLDGVLSFCEMAQPLVARLAEHLGLPGNSPAAVDAARDK